MKLRKTLAGILGAVVMLLGVGTFEHVNRDTGVQAATTVKSYIKVTSAPTDWSGDYLIVYETGKKCFDGSLGKLDAASNYKDVIISNGVISYSENLANSQFTIAKSGSNYTIKTANGYYIGNNSDSNSLSSSTSTKYTNTISLESDGTVKIVSSGNSVLRYNATSGQDRFRYFKSSTYGSQKGIHLYKYSETETSEPEGLLAPVVEIGKYTGIATWSEIYGAIKYEYVIDNGTPVIVETDDELSVQLSDGQSIQVKAIGDGTDYTDSSYSEKKTYTQIPVTSTIQGWVEEYYHEGVYTKKSEIHLSEDADFELSDVIHHDEKQPVSLDRTTYYNDEALFMSNLDGSIGGDGQINSGYKTEGSDLRHFTLNSNNEPVNDWKVSNTTLKEFFITLDNFRVEGYFDNWTLSETGATFTVTQSNKNSETVKDFIAFAAPCLENIFEGEFANYFSLNRLVISEDKNDRNEEYLSLKIYLDNDAYHTDTKKGTVDNQECLLAEARIYAGNKVFDELECKNLKVSSYTNGTVIYTPEKDFYKENEEVTFTVMPDEGYIVESVLFNDKAVNDNFDKDGFTFSINLVNKNNTVKVIFSEIPQVVEPVKFIFSGITGSVQYKEETHQLDSNTSLYIKNCYINTQLRIYSTASNNGEAIFTSTIAISELKLNAGYKADTLLVYGSNDGGANWVKIGSITTTTSYKDYTLSFGGKTYTSIKLDVSGTQQVRIANITFTY